MEVRFCHNCGAKLKENTKFCGICGTPVLQFPEPKSEAAAPVFQPEPEAPETGATSVKAVNEVAVPSANTSSVKASSAKRKTALKAMKKYEQRSYKMVSVEQALAKIKNDNAR